MIYLNACSHGLPAPRTLRVMAAHLEREAQLGEARAAAEVAPALARAHADAARMMACARSEVGFAVTTTQIWTAVLDRAARPGARILLCDLEWGAHVRHAAHLAQRLDMRLDIVPASEAADPAAWAERLDEDVAVMAAPMVTSITGQILPVADIAALPRPDGTLTLLDAAQGVGRLPMAGLQGWDIVAATSRKWLRAPRQTALLRLSPRASKRLTMPPDAFAGFAPNVPLRLGLGDALAAHLAHPPAPALEALDLILRTALDGTGWLRPKGAPGTVTLAVPLDGQPAAAAALETANLTAKWCNTHQDEPRAPWPDGTAALRISPLPDMDPETLRAALPTLCAALGR